MHPKYFIIPLLFFALTAFSQDKKDSDTSGVSLQEVVVVGTRTVEKIIDLPYSVFTVDKNELSFGRKVSAKDILADVPGLFLQSHYGNHDLSISIRGFGNRSNNGVRGVKILQDGIPESDPDGETTLDAINFSSLGAVEVVKSNLSSLYSNAPGGVINFISDLNFPENYVTMINQAGQYGLVQNGFKTGYKTNDYRFLLSYTYQNLNGFRQHSSEYQHLLNAIYEAHAGARSVLTIMTNYVDGINYIPGALTEAEFAADPFQANPLAVSQDFHRFVKKGKAGLKLKTYLNDNGDAELEITGYGGIKEQETADNQSIALLTRYTLGSSVRFSDRFNLAGRLNVISLGIEYANESGPLNDFENLYGNRGPSVEHDYDGSLSNIGLYLLDHINLVQEKLEFFLSGRFDSDVFSRSIYIPYGFTDTSREFQKFAPKAGLNYKLTPSIALYTSYGYSYDFPALSELLNTPLSSNIKYAINPDLNAQQSKDFEVGLKGDIANRSSEFMRKIFFEATFFDYNVTDEIIPFVISQQTYYRNAAKTERTGLEMSLKTESFEGFELTANYTFTHFRYSDYLTTVFTPSGSVTQSFTNNTVPAIPEHLVSLILNYEFEVSEQCSGLLQWDCDYLSSMYVDDANSQNSPAYFYGSPMMGASFAFGPFHPIAYLGIKNIFDRRYAGYIDINDYYGRFYEMGEPRTFYSGLNVSYQF